MSLLRARCLAVVVVLSAAFCGCASDPAGASDEPASGGQLGAGAGGASAGSGASLAGAAGAPIAGGAANSAAGASNATSAGAAGSDSGAGGTNASTGGARAAGSGGRGGVGGASTAGAGGQSGAGQNAGGSGALGNVTIWIAGDSTVATGGPCPIGWGGKFKALFNSKVTVNNAAVGGRSVRTWLYDVQATKDSTGECTLGKDAKGDPTVQARWTTMLTGMKAGDYLFIQFGINDGDSTCPRHVGQDAFKTSYGMMAQAAKDRGAIPIFVTPVSQIACSGSTVSKNTREPFVSATKAAATQSGAAVIDLNVLSATLYQSLGFCPIPGGDISASTTGAVGTFFCDDHTHFDTTGATQIAGLVAAALRAQNIALAKYLLES